MYLYLCKHNTVYERSILCALIKLHQHKHHVRGKQQEVRGGRRDDVTLGRGVAHIVTIPQSAMIISNNLVRDRLGYGLDNLHFVEK